MRGFSKTRLKRGELRAPPIQNVVPGTNFTVDWHCKTFPKYQHSFLTHAHTDHVNGIQSFRRPRTLHCTKITAKMIDVDGQPVLHSGAIAHRQNYLYGKFEFRVKADRDPSGVMSAVVLTWPQSEDWPNDGENDIYETHEANIERDHFTSNIMSGLPLNKWSNKSYNIDATEWHTVAMEWQETAIRIYIDDVLRWRLTDPKDFCHTPHHLCIQLDAFAQEMTGETRMYVDWVKIYQEKKSEE